MSAALVLGIDPGNIESAYALIDATTRRPVNIGKVPNMEMRQVIRQSAGSTIAIEMIASYGMAVGQEVFDTCLWIGRFAETCWVMPELVYRRDIKLHHCGSSKAKDANIAQALVDRFAPGQPNRGKGTKAAQGWFYGFRADIWQAAALAVYVADRQEGYQP